MQYFEKNGTYYTLFTPSFVFENISDYIHHSSINPSIFMHCKFAVSELEFNVPFQHKHGYIRDERSGMESYLYPVKEG